MINPAKLLFVFGARSGASASLASAKGVSVTIVANGSGQLARPLEASFGKSVPVSVARSLSSGHLNLSQPTRSSANAGAMLANLITMRLISMLTRYPGQLPDVMNIHSSFFWRKSRVFYARSYGGEERIYPKLVLNVFNWAASHERSARGRLSSARLSSQSVFCSALALVALSLRIDCFRQKSDMRSFSDKPKLQLRRLLPQRQLRFTARQNMQTMYAVGPHL